MTNPISPDHLAPLHAAVRVAHAVAVASGDLDDEVALRAARKALWDAELADADRTTRRELVALRQIYADADLANCWRRP